MSATVQLDDEPIELTDVVTVIEPGEDGDVWTIREFTTADGTVCLIEHYEEEVTLYRRDERDPATVHIARVVEQGEYRAESQRDGSSALTYIEQVDQDDNYLLWLNDARWIISDTKWR